MPMLDSIAASRLRDGMNRLPTRNTVRHVLAISAFGALLLNSPTTFAQPFEGNFTWTIDCGLLTGLTVPLHVPFSMTVSNGQARYEREIMRPGGPTGTVRTGNYERGIGTVTPSGEVSLRGSGEGKYMFEAEYRGHLGGSPIRLAGTQRWRNRERTEERSCQVELVPSPPRS